MGMLEPVDTLFCLPNDTLSLCLHYLEYNCGLRSLLYWLW